MLIEVVLWMELQKEMDNNKDKRHSARWKYQKIVSVHQ